MQADGWKVEKISLLANPNQVRPKRFWGVYTKLKVFNLTKYKKGKSFMMESGFCILSMGKEDVCNSWKLLPAIIMSLWLF